MEYLDFLLNREKGVEEHMEKVGKGGSLISCLADQLLLTQMLGDQVEQVKEGQVKGEISQRTWNRRWKWNFFWNGKVEQK